MPPLFDQLKTINRIAFQSAGARYTPMLDANAPNLEIADAVAFVHALALSPEYQHRIHDLAREIRDAYRPPSRMLRRAFYRCAKNPIALADLLDKLARATPG